MAFLKRSASRGSGAITLVAAVFLVLVLGATVYVGVTGDRSWYQEGLRRVEGRATLFVQQLRTEVIAPPPLRGTLEARAALLTEAGVVRETNEERRAAGLAPLTVNAQLAAAADAKLQDMFDQQYFDHVSPSGEGPSEVVKGAGYAYVVVGENLALGNFEDDAALVAAWMASPGHRENILNGRFSEIGVAVGRGVFEGHRVWMAVQEFGRPLSDCPPPSASLKRQIDANQLQLTQMEAMLEAKRAELEAHQGSREEYNRKVAEYNVLVEQYNALLQRTRDLVASYNARVVVFNACIAQ